MTMTGDTGNDAEQKSFTREVRVGLVADAPNFPAAWDLVLEKVRLADELGFDAVWLGESWGYELFTSMSDLVRATKRIKIGAGIANIYSRTPALLASTVATLDERSGGRIQLGLGPSAAQVIEHWHGVPFEKPLQRTREYIDIIRMILRGDKLLYQGEFFQLERGFKLRFKPLRADLPIYVAAMGPKNIQQTGAIADGVLPVYWPATKWDALRSQLDAGLQSANRPPHSAVIAPYITTVILSEDASPEVIRAAELQAASPLAYYIGKMGVYYAQMLTRNGYGEDVQAVLHGWEQGMKTALASVSPRLLEDTAIIGTAQECAAKIKRWVAAGVDEPLLTMPAGSLDETAAQLSALKEALEG
ncbi:LLM class flavin-dependent oxidoreductase [Dictyobacter arantiisoli]|uniref:LLM class F420-dependent oxidoreductase n=1 Tax=Dictyobacter arantiisoli TaxID=2014874 RepID=A0A5A5T8Q6_9CHLR|nr:LLM class flavin-dependent oxidoreductase [Dictyobacter arantiisoli]GCF07423.1 LLM class F420-dependent oxidoreductase [Dictyobacter arantiisoli]